MKNILRFNWIRIYISKNKNNKYIIHFFMVILIFIVFSIILSLSISSLPTAFTNQLIINHIDYDAGDGEALLLKWKENEFNIKNKNTLITINKNVPNNNINNNLGFENDIKNEKFTIQENKGSACIAKTNIIAEKINGIKRDAGNGISKWEPKQDSYINFQIYRYGSSLFLFVAAKKNSNNDVNNENNDKSFIWPNGLIIHGTLKDS